MQKDRKNRVSAYASDIWRQRCAAPILLFATNVHVALLLQTDALNVLRGKLVEGPPKYVRIRTNYYTLPKNRKGITPEDCKCNGQCGDVSRVVLGELKQRNRMGSRTLIK